MSQTVAKKKIKDDRKCCNLGNSKAKHHSTAKSQDHVRLSKSEELDSWKQGEKDC